MVSMGPDCRLRFADLWFCLSPISRLMAEIARLLSGLSVGSGVLFA